MAIERKQLSDGEQVWLDGQGNPYPVPAKVLGEEQRRALDAQLLDAAGMEVPGVRRWFAFRTLGRGEIEIRDALVKMHVDAVVPEKRVVLPRRGVRPGGKAIQIPVLRKLIFVRVAQSDQAVAGLLRVRGIQAVIGKGDRPHPIGDRQMTAFMDLAQKGAFDERNIPTGLNVGSRVKINVGPYAAFSGVLEGYAKGRAARVRTMLFGADMIVDVKLAQIERLA
ncbi:MAG: transcription termination/antitermination protein NusG [Aliihoeflea sp.]|uniref:transcription termination/antitermination protein NusG n=1 Tax=Aliihoeflea sp. TaxID=2608088 RepID=UPI0040349541